MKPGADSEVLTFLFTDIEGSSRLWEEQPARMPQALALHDAILRSAIQRYRGVIVKPTGDGVHAAFRDPHDAIAAAVEVQRVLADPQATGGLALPVRCGMELGVSERRDGDFFGSPVNRAARIMSAAHGGQVLASQTVIDLGGGHLPKGISLRDLGLVRLQDLSQPVRLYQVAHPELRAVFPPLRSLEATPNNLPQQVTSFVGRARELAEIEALLKSTRLLTLVGAGGIGKTRLALQAAAALLDDYPDGVWFIRFAALDDARVVAQAAASVLGVKEQTGSTLEDALRKHCKDRRCLLILDNCEHLIQACAELASALLEAGPVRILATSRESLRVPGETAYQVPPLPVPEISMGVTPDDLSQYEAVGLFVTRALAIDPSFQVTSRNAASIAEVCIRLDGIPLALELAAARLQALPVEEIAARLTDRFRLLTGGHRTVLPRHQTLRALIDWSYELLTSAERALLRRLAVFAGGWTLEAAEAVAVGGEVPMADLVALLSALIEKSLVVRSASGERYRLLETIRQYAQDRLDESDEGPATRTRHLRYFVAFADGARAGLTGPEQTEWLARLDLERENLLAAHAWCDHAEIGAEQGLRLVHAVQPYLLRRGVLEHGRRILAEALSRPGAQKSDVGRCKALFAAGWQSNYMGRYEDAAAYLEESLSIAREIDDETMIAMVLQPLGMAAMGKGDMSAAHQYLEEALVLAERSRNTHQIVAALNSLGQLVRLDGQLDRAEELYSSVLAIAREHGERESAAIALLNLAMAFIGRRHAEGVGEMVFEALAIAEEIGSIPTGQSVLEVAAGLAALRADWEHVALFFGAAEALAKQTGLRRDPVDDAFLAPRIERARGTLEPGAFSAIAADGAALAYDAAKAKVRNWLTAGIGTAGAGDLNS